MSRDQRGRFLPGFDPDRHRLTRRERQRGYRVMKGGGRNGQLTPAVIESIAHKVQRYFAKRKRSLASPSRPSRPRSPAPTRQVS
jgi:hypothetical protein